MAKDKPKPLTKNNMKMWREQVKEERKKLFSELKFDKFGRIIKDLK